MGLGFLAFQIGPSAVVIPCLLTSCIQGNTSPYNLCTRVQAQGLPRMQTSSLRLPLPLIKIQAVATMISFVTTTSV